MFGHRVAALCLTCALWGAPPEVEKVEPPDWWTGTKWNPVRVLVRGKDLTGARVAARAPLLASNVRVSGAGTHLFVDVRIPATARAGKYPLSIRTPDGRVEAAFELVSPLPAQGRFAGVTQDDVLYLIMPDRFANGDRGNDDPAKSRGLFDPAKARFYHGGDLQGIIDRLDYLRELGATALWLNPWYDNNDRLNERETYDGRAITDYHGYGATDFYAVDEHLGDLALLRKLTDEAHRRGIKIVQDQVANHSGPYHVWTKDPPTPTWYNGTVASHPNNTWQTWTLMDPYATAATRRETIDGWFINILPDFNQSDPEVEKYLIQNSLWWVARTGLDAIRQDTLPYAPRTYWSAWMKAVKREFPSVNVIGEVFDGDPALVAYFQGGVKRGDGVDSGIDTLFDFPAYFPLRRAFGEGQSLRQLPQALAHDFLYPNPSLLVTFLGLHDVERFMNVKGATLAGLKLAFTYLFTVRGVPLIYYGDEIAMPGGGDPDNRRDFPAAAFSAAERSAEQQDLFAHIRDLAKKRRDLAPLRRGTLRNHYVSEQQWVFTREYQGQAVWVAMNNDQKPARVAAGGQVFELAPRSAIIR